MSLVLDHDINVFVFLYCIGLHDLGTRFHIVGWQIVDTRDSITNSKETEQSTESDFVVKHTFCYISLR